MKIKLSFLPILLFFSVETNAIFFNVVAKEDAVWVVFQDDTLDPLEVVAELRRFLGSSLGEYLGQPNVTDREMNGGFVLIEFPRVFMPQHQMQGILRGVRAFLNRSFRAGGTWPAPPPIPIVDENAGIAERIFANEQIIRGFHRGPKI